MSMGSISQSSYSKTVKTVLSKVHDATALNDSVYEVATDYFRHAKLQEEKLLKLQLQVRGLEQKQELSSREQKQLAEAQSGLKLYIRMLDDRRVERYRSLKAVCLTVLQLTEGESFEETVQMSSKFLGTIQLLAPSNGKYVASVNQKFKHLYKGILSLRLLDRLLLDNELNNNYVIAKMRAAKEMQDADSAAAYKSDYAPFRDDVQLPLLMAALLQDIGTYHPDALAILKGAEGEQDEFRVLDEENRVALLKINYQETLNYVTKGLSCDRYVGNSKEERELFNQNEQDKLNFVYTLLKNAIKPEGGVGNLLKIPQIYTSVVLSTKSNHSYESLPKAALVLQSGVERGYYHKAAVDALIKITGLFPQGYGVTYIPKDSDKRDLDRYEYALVVSLYPPAPDVPVCRVVTRNMAFSHAGTNVVISVDNNLHFPAARKKLEKMSEERLLEILSKLVSNFEERKNMDLIPKCWFPDEYFSYSKNQNLWNRVTTIQN
ncbi:hypothetical protein EMM73_12580 [Rheinheimera sediminis]|uniref:hypothetical protein n=1 Tax=Rheinheimera sp. YQF-1 TaxID=2499626 RepID=UPI000FDAAD86|nr:hypothetical protein [Rheinheimera sp. YQF-1]RVT45537.1 hypothetical protein EMM73_12580 [Rheinheimera sp. YQF-1]